MEVYHKTYEDLLLADPENNYLNDGKGSAEGIDFFLKKELTTFSGWISYSRLNARRKWMDIPVMTSPFFDITHNLNCVLTATLPGGFSLGLRYRYATGKPYSSGPALYNDKRVPPYRKMDCNLSWSHSFFGRDQTILYCAASNIFNRINIFDYRYSRDFQDRTPVTSSFGRSFYFGIQFNMGEQL